MRVLRSHTNIAVFVFHYNKLGQHGLQYFASLSAYQCRQCTLPSRKKVSGDISCSDSDSVSVDRSLAVEFLTLNSSAFTAADSRITLVAEPEVAQASARDRNPGLLVLRHTCPRLRLHLGLPALATLTSADIDVFAISPVKHGASSKAERT